MSRFRVLKQEDSHLGLHSDALSKNNKVSLFRTLCLLPSEPILGVGGCVCVNLFHKTLTGLSLGMLLVQKAILPRCHDHHMGPDSPQLTDHTVSD